MRTQTYCIVVAICWLLAPSIAAFLQVPDHTPGVWPVCATRSTTLCSQRRRTSCIRMTEEWVKDAVLPNKLGVLSLDRPKALNAADKSMTATMLQILAEWEGSGAVQALLLKSTSERAFCSGGDVKAIALDLKADPASQTPFTALSNEYRLLCSLERWASTARDGGRDIPSVAIMDGVTMGFGVGLACNTRYRVMTERTLVAMPENAIGLFPDIGFAHLTRHHPALGLYLALTGKRIGGKASTPADIMMLGLGTHYVHSTKLAALVSALETADLAGDPDKAIRDILTAHAQDCDEAASLAALQPIMQSCFTPTASTRVADIIAALEKAAGGHAAGKELEKTEDTAAVDPREQAAEDALAALKMGAPTSLEVTLAHFRTVRASMGAGSPLSLQQVPLPLAPPLCVVGGGEGRGRWWESEGGLGSGGGGREFTCLHLFEYVAMCMWVWCQERNAPWPHA